MKLMSDKRLRKECRYAYDRGFSEAVKAIATAINAGDKVIVGDSMSFVGLKASAPVSIVGNSTNIANSQFTMDNKWKLKGDTLNNIKISAGDI